MRVPDRGREGIAGVGVGRGLRLGLAIGLGAIGLVFVGADGAGAADVVDAADAIERDDWNDLVLRRAVGWWTLGAVPRAVDTLGERDPDGPQDPASDYLAVRGSLRIGDRRGAARVLGATEEAAGADPWRNRMAALGLREALADRGFATVTQLRA